MQLLNCLSFYVQDRIYFSSQLMSMSVASGFHLMSRSVYLYICGKDMDDVPDAEIRAMCDAVNGCIICFVLE